MRTYRLDTTVTKDGAIILPRRFANMFAHQVEVTIKEKNGKEAHKKLDVPVYSCGGKVTDTDFSREEIYDDKL